MNAASVPPACRLFVYGSLKRGYRNHDAYCAGYHSLRPATVPGQLYRQPEGYPMLLVPPSSILGIASGDWEPDQRLFAQLLESLAAKHPEPWSKESEAGDWQAIQGELLEWEPAGFAQRIARLDELEEFFPGKPSLYHRAIVALTLPTGPELCWTYIAPHGVLPARSERMGRSWP